MPTKDATERALDTPIPIASRRSGRDPSSTGQWNETYLGQLEGTVDQLRDQGMYAILDMHQDQMRGVHAAAAPGGAAHNF